MTVNRAGLSYAGYFVPPPVGTVGNYNGTLVNTAGQELTIDIKCPYARSDKFKDRKCIGILLHNPLVSENDIFPVKIRHPAKHSKVMGWIIPLQAFSSLEHSKSQDNNFIWALSQAYDLILNAAEITINVDSLENTDCLIEDLFPTNTSLLILDQAFCDEFDCGKCESLLLSLFTFGYWSGKGGSLCDYRGTAVTKAFDDLRTKAYLTLSVPQDQSDLAYYESILELFAVHIKSPLASFLTFYQVFEVLIARIFNERALGIIESLSKTKDSDEIRDQMDKYSALMGEKHRINILFSDKIRDKPDRAGLEKACADLFALLKQPTAEERLFPACLYQVRNKVVHNTGRFHGATLRALLSVNSELEVFAPELLLNYPPTPRPRSEIDAASSAQPELAFTP